jgi:hypothetical protein
LNVTVPVGTPVPGLSTVTVAVNVTDSPNLDGFALDVSEVDVSALSTVCVSESELPLKLPSPPYEAVIEWPPTLRAEVEKLA